MNVGPDANSRLYLERFLLVLGGLALLTALVLAPLSFLWLYQSGDSGVERAAEAQASGTFALFGSGISQDFIEYKLMLYKAIKPEIVAIGSSRVMQFRGAWFRESFLNMGGVAGNLAVLRSTIDAMLKISRPKAVILGIDFWWFLPQWEKDPHETARLASGTYNYSFANLKKPWEWLLEGKISFRQLGAPILGIFGKGFRADRFGIMAQQTDDGFGPDGSWYYTAEITGMKQAPDYQFQDTLRNIGNGSRAFYHADKGQAGPAQSHVEAFAEIWCRLRSRGIQTFVFMPPLAARTLAAMGQGDYPHLYRLREAFLECGMDVADLTNPALLGSDDCEFVDGFHGGEILYARILRALAERWPALLAYVNMEKIDAIVRDWQGHALAADARLTKRPEIDFLGLGCQKRSRLEGKQ
ncbi:MAG: hypothetical protein HDQ91_02210 [Desulfovibrio sp.]|nr:hypothetical protein [Desulfovibrio sp.]